jgi:hypothetical protein
LAAATWIKRGAIEDDGSGFVVDRDDRGIERGEVGVALIEQVSHDIVPLS